MAERRFYKAYTGVRFPYLPPDIGVLPGFDMISGASLEGDSVYSIPMYGGLAQW